MSRCHRYLPLQKYSFLCFQRLSDFQVSCISQLVHIDNADLIVIFLKHVVDIIGSNKSRSACYQIELYCHNFFF